MPEAVESVASVSGRGFRQRLTVLFSDLTNSTQLARYAEAELYVELWQQLTDSIKRIIPKHGGTVCQIRGDGVLAVFSLEGREDDGRRAAAAALELHEAVRSLTFGHKSSPVELTMHSGIHSGLVLLVEGDDVLGRYLLVGDAANYAAHLSDQANANEILVTEETLGTDRHFFEVANRRLLELKGSPTAIPVYPILGYSNVVNRFEARRLRGLSPMLGRERELNELRGRYQSTSQGEMQSIAIVAPPGMGKTRLAEEFLAETDNATVLRGYCESYLSAEPLQPVLQMLRGLLLPRTNADNSPATPVTIDRQIAIRIAKIAPELQHAVPTLSALLEPAGERHPLNDEIEQIIVSLFQCLAHARPLIVFIDDLQWSDELTRRIFGAASQLTDCPIMFLCSSRETVEFDASGTLLHLRLTPLDEGQSERVFRQLMPAAEPFVVTEIRDASGGNPLFLEELCHASLHSDGVSSSLRMLIASRAQRLSDSQRELLRIAAVIGLVVPIELLEEIAVRREISTDLEALRQLDFLFPGESPGTVRFKHGITHEVVFESVGLYERRELHQRVANTLEKKYV